MAKPLVIPCCQKSLCLSDAPILNLSAELSDGPSFIGVNFGGQNIPPIGTTYRDPPGSPCFTVSGDQLVAEAGAERCQVRHDTDDPGGGGGDWHDPNGDPPALYGNTAQACSINCADGLPFTYTVPAGSYIGLNQIIVDRIAHSYACQLATLNRVCLSSLSSSACLNQEYSDTIIPLGQAPFTFTVVQGSLPPGLEFSSTDTVATVSGTPTMTGSFSFMVRLVDARGNFMQKTFIIDVLDITNKNQAPAATAGSPYSFQLTGDGGNTPYVFSSEDLPDGLTISEDGLISGTPSASGNVNSTVTITDARGSSCDFALTTSPCQFFDTLVWDTPFIVPCGGAFNTCSWTNTFNGRTVEMTGEETAFTLGQPLVVINSALMPGVTDKDYDCTVQVNIKSVSGPAHPPAAGGWFLEVVVFPPGGGHSAADSYVFAFTGQDFFGAGVFEFPIHIPAGIQVGVEVVINIGGGDIGSGPLSGSIDVVVTCGV